MTSSAGPAPFLRRYGALCSTATGAAASRAAGSASARAIHLRHWAQGGPTTLDNLALLCRLHHRAVHEEGFQVERHADGELHFRRPDGRPIPDVPPPVAVPPDPMEALWARHRAQGLTLHPRSLTPSWLGERLDLGWALDVLHPLANPVVGLRRN